MADPTFSLVNFQGIEGLTKPATMLIEKVAGAVEGIYRPYQIRRVAQAEADAEVIKEAAAIKVSDLQRRALTRWLNEETKKQSNMDAILQKALPQLANDATPEQIEDDWLTAFFDKCRLVSDEDMQRLWAKVLASEANKPRSFSLRTISVLHTLDKEDAEQFRALCSLIWRVDKTDVPIIYDPLKWKYRDHGVTFL